MSDEKKVTFVTGGASGIGKAVCFELSSKGESLIIADIDESKGVDTCKKILSNGGEAIFQKVDVRKRNEIRHASDTGLKEFGKITGLVNCAGLVTMTSLDELTEEEWDLVVDVNLKGTWLTTQEVSRDIAAAGGGAVVNISTVEAEVVVSSKGYCQVH